MPRLISCSRCGGEAAAPENGNAPLCGGCQAVAAAAATAAHDRAVRRTALLMARRGRIPRKLFLEVFT
jgi:hypothetical protein